MVEIQPQATEGRAAAVARKLWAGVVSGLWPMSAIAPITTGKRTSFDVGDVPRSRHQYTLAVGTFPANFHAPSGIAFEEHRKMSGSPATIFQNAEAYERIMGRWSQRLAPQLIQFGGLLKDERVLDVGCGTGSLSLALPQFADVSAVVGIDLVEGYVTFARDRNKDARISFRQGDACSLPFADKSFDRAYSMLVLHFIPDSVKAVSEMRRVVRPGGTVTAAVWDEYGGLPHYRMLVDVAATLDPSVERRLFLPLTAPGEMETLWRDLGMLDVEQTSLSIRMEFNNFDDYWRPFTAGEGPPGRLIASMSDPARAALQDHMRRAYVANRPDGPRSFACTAWACRGTVSQ